MHGEVMADQAQQARGVKGHSTSQHSEIGPSTLGLRGGLHSAQGLLTAQNLMHNRRGPRNAAFELKPLALIAHATMA
jgi:hypothetical protein